MSDYKIETKCIQSGYEPGNGDPRIVPIYQSTTFRYTSSEQMGRLFDLEESGYFYTRLQNPTNDAVAAKICDLEGGVAAMLTSSGQAANFYAVMNIAQAGDHIVCASALYGGTYNLYAHTIRKMGVEATFVDPDCTEEELEAAMVSAQQEALSFFANDEVYIEKFIVNPRHVEIQILADSYGNVVHLGERDCSMQRRNQKVLEESPCPVLPDGIRRKMGEAAVAAAKACGYKNAGTIEFLLAEDGQFYFMEMNTRIQVEHPVTELVTGIDLVRQQILIAAGERLPFKQEEIRLVGHAIECRINAEDPAHHFRPSPGKITALHMPGGPGIRIDSAVYQGFTISPYYDSMIAKLIAYAPTRDEAIRKMKWALAEFLVEGVDTNIDFQLALLRDKNFETGQYDIGYLGRKLAQEQDKQS